MGTGYALCPSYNSDMSSIAQLLHEAIAAHQARRFADAQRLYKRVLKAAPDQPDASTWVLTKGPGASWAKARHPRRHDIDRHAI
jgi:hypothetical protein